MDQKEHSCFPMALRFLHQTARPTSKNHREARPPTSFYFNNDHRFPFYMPLWSHSCLALAALHFSFAAVEENQFEYICCCVETKPPWAEVELLALYVDRLDFGLGGGRMSADRLLKAVFSCIQSFCVRVCVSTCFEVVRQH